MRSMCLGITGLHAAGQESCAEEPSRWNWPLPVCVVKQAHVWRRMFFLRDVNVDIPVADSRQIEVVANGLRFGGGAQIAVDTTILSPVRGDGAPRLQADARPGIPCEAAIRDKVERKYRELLRARRCRLQVLAFEVGGRWDKGALKFLRQLARARARAAPAWLRHSTAQAYAYRWSALLAVAVQRAFAASLLHLPLEGELQDGEAPACSDLLADARFLSAQEVSRMPLI